MAKSLVDKLKGGFRSIRRNLKNIILSATAVAFLYGATACNFSPDPDPKPEPGNNPPEINVMIAKQ